MACCVAYALRWPDEEVYLFGVIPMKSRWLIAAMIAMNIIFALSPSSGIDWTAHIGGMAFGWVFLKLYSVGRDRPCEGLGFRCSGRIRGHAARSPARADRRCASRPRGVDEVVARSNAVVLRETKPLQHVPKQETPKEYAARVNRVLDKISQHGIESLTREERRLLEEMSRKLRDE